MAKIVTKFGLGLALGALAGHLLSTEKGQENLSKLKDEVLALKADPVAYKESLVTRAKGLVASQLQVAYDNKEEILGFFGQEEVSNDTVAAEVDDIIISYQEEEQETDLEVG